MGDVTDRKDSVVNWLNGFLDGEKVLSRRESWVTRGGNVVTRVSGIMPRGSLSLLRSLHMSDVHRQAVMTSDSTGSGEQLDEGSTGLSRLPSRILVEKHSRITAVIKNHR